MSTNSGRTRTGDGYVDPIIQEDDGVLDEFVLTDCTIHFEAMSDNDWWVGISKGERTWAIRLGTMSDRAKAYAHVEEETALGLNALVTDERTEK